MTAVLVDCSPSFHLSPGTRGQISVLNSTNMDPKEHADRMAAAEALGALSSMAVVNTGGNPQVYVQQTANYISDNSNGAENGKTRRKSKGSMAEHETSKSRSRAKWPRTTRNVNSKRRGAQKDITQNSPKQTASGEKTKKTRKAGKKTSAVSESETVSEHNDKATESEKQKTLEIPTLNSGNFIPNLPSLPSIPSLFLPTTSTPDLSSFSRLGSSTFLNDIEAGPRALHKTVDTKSDISTSVSDSRTDKYLPFKKRRLVTEDREKSPTSSGKASESESKSVSQNSQPVVKDTSTNSSETRRTATFPEHLPLATQQQLRREISAVLTPDEDGDLPLHLAVVHEHQPLVDKFIMLMRIAKRSVDKFNKDKQTPLHLAVKLNFLSAVKSLLEAGADVNLVDKTGCTSLHLAVKHQLKHCLKYLCENSKNKHLELNSRNFDGFTPLHTAVELRDVQMVQLLLDNGADVDTQDGKSGRSPLFHAAENNQVDIVKLFLQRGANAVLTNYAGITALMSSQARNLTTISKLLGNATEEAESHSNTPSPGPETKSENSHLSAEVENAQQDEVGVSRVGRMWKHTVPLRNPATSRRQADNTKHVSVAGKTVSDDRDCQSRNPPTPNSQDNPDLGDHDNNTSTTTTTSTEMEWRQSSEDTSADKSCEGQGRDTRGHGHEEMEVEQSESGKNTNKRGNDKEKNPVCLSIPDTQQTPDVEVERRKDATTAATTTTTTTTSGVDTARPTHSSLVSNSVPGPGVSPGSEPASSADKKLPFSINTGNIHQILRMIQLHDPETFNKLIQRSNVTTRTHSTVTQPPSTTSSSPPTSSPSPQTSSPSPSSSSSAAATTFHSKADNTEHQHQKGDLPKAAVNLSSDAVHTRQVLVSAGTTASAPNSVASFVPNTLMSALSNQQQAPIVMSNQQQPYMLISSQHPVFAERHLVVTNQKTVSTGQTIQSASQQRDIPGPRTQSANQRERDKEAKATAHQAGGEGKTRVSSPPRDDSAKQQEIMKQMLRQKVLKSLPSQNKRGNSVTPPPAPQAAPSSQENPGAEWSQIPNLLKIDEDVETKNSVVEATNCSTKPARDKPESSQPAGKEKFKSYRESPPLSTATGRNQTLPVVQIQRPSPSNATRDSQGSRSRKTKKEMAYPCLTHQLSASNYSQPSSSRKQPSPSNNQPSPSS